MLKASEILVLPLRKSLTQPHANRPAKLAVENRNIPRSNILWSIAYWLPIGFKLPITSKPAKVPQNIPITSLKKGMPVNIPSNCLNGSEGCMTGSLIRMARITIKVP